MAFDHVVKILATGVSDCAHTALAWTQGHPVQAGMTGLSFGLAPFFGFGWMPALLLKAVGFGKLGVGAGGLGHAGWITYYVLIQSAVRIACGLVSSPFLRRIYPGLEHVRCTPRSGCRDRVLVGSHADWKWTVHLAKGDGDFHGFSRATKGLWGWAYEGISCTSDVGNVAEGTLDFP